MQVVNKIAIDGQWLKENDIFDVIMKNDISGHIIRSKDSKHYNDNIDNSNNINLQFTLSTPDLEKEIIKALKYKYPANTFEIHNQFTVELI